MRELEARGDALQSEQERSADEQGREFAERAKELEERAKAVDEREQFLLHRLGERAQPGSEPADQDDRHPVVEAEQQLNELSGADHLRDQVEGDGDQ